MSRFCGECGAPLIEGAKFCGQCGTAVHRSPQDWGVSIVFAEIAHQPAVTAMVQQVTGSKRSAMSGDAFMRNVFRIAGAAGSTGPIPLSLVATAGQELWSRAGVKTNSTADFDLPELKPGHVIAAVLCSFAAHGYALDGSEQAEDGCILKAKLPMSLSTLGGELRCAVRPLGDGSSVAATVTVPGQAFDWGRGKRTLEQLHADLPDYARQFAAG